MKDFIKANLKVLPVTIFFCAISVYAAGTITANSIVYANGNNVATVQEALDTLYNSIDVVTITPIGSVLPYMGINAPDNYLLCDGSTYNIADYQKLANHIKNNFGSYDYFGGDGTTTFAVPDLRGEFLRGAGTNSHANSGNGAAVGKHQEGTHFPGFSIRTDNGYFSGVVNKTANENYTGPMYTDKSIKTRTAYSTVSATITNYVDNVPAEYIARPTNTSVNYIIKVK